LVVGYALWILSRVAGAARIFWFYAAGVAAWALPFVALQFLFTGVFPDSLTAYDLYLIWVGLLFVATLVGGALVFLSLMTVARKMGYRLFLWAGLLLLVGAVVSALNDITGYSYSVLPGFAMPFAMAAFATTLGYAGIVLEAFAFNSLQGQPRKDSANRVELIPQS
jgi:uncharacterized membrane protein